MRHQLNPSESQPLHPIGDCCGRPAKWGKKAQAIIAVMIPSHRGSLVVAEIRSSNRLVRAAAKKAAKKKYGGLGA